MSPQHDCHHCCLTRRQCLQVLSASALGAGALSSPLRILGQDSAAPAKTDFVDAASLRPKPDVRVCGTFLQQPRPYWLGWPGTTYDLDKHQKEYRQKLDESVARVGIQMGWEATPVSDEAGLAQLDRQDQGAKAARAAGRATAHAMLELDRTDRQRDGDSADRVRPGGHGLHGARRPRCATAQRPRHLVAGMARRRSRAEDDQGQAAVRGNSRAVDSRQGEQRDGHGPAGREGPRHPARHVQPGIRQAAGHGRSEGHGQRPAQERRRRSSSRTRRTRSTRCGPTSRPSD